MTDSANIATAKRFYDIADGRVTGDLTELFTEDVTIYVPKFGPGRGLAAMIDAGKGRAQFRAMSHHIDQFDIVEHGDRVIIEGTTEGETVTGRTWDGRTTVPGHFCAVFDFRDGRISRMHVYFDPDLGHEDTDRYPWWFQHKENSVTDTVDGVIRHTGEMNEVYFQRRFDAPPERLWSFVSEPELMQQWLGGPVDTLEKVPGGEVVIQIGPKLGATVHGKVLSYEPGRLLEFTWDVPAWHITPDLIGTIMRWEVTADSAGSAIQLTHSLPHAAFREHLLAAAWHLHLDQLGRLLGGSDEPYTIQQPHIHALVLRYLDKDSAAKREYYEKLLGIGLARS